MTYLCYEGRALECQYDVANDTVGDVACLKALEYGTSPKWAAAEKIMGTGATYGACQNETFDSAYRYAADYASNPLASPEDCSKTCFNVYGAFLSAFKEADGECNCYSGSFGDTCTDSDDVDGLYELWKVTKIDENSDAKVFKDIIEGEDPTGANLFDGLWAIKDRAVAEDKEFFEDKYPHCLPSGDDVKELIESQACDTADDCTNGNFPHCVSGLCVDNTDPAAAATEYEAYEKLAMHLAEEKVEAWDWGIEYLIYNDDFTMDIEVLPLYVSTYGEVCANIYDTDEATARVLYAAADGQFDASAPAITADTLEEDLPENVKNLLQFLDEEDWDYYTAN